MEHFYIYLKGLIIVSSSVIWIIVFNFIWNKLNPNDKLKDWGALFLPFILPFSILMILFVPYLVGVEFFN